MRIYLDLVFLLNFVVDLLLLAGTNRLLGIPVAWKKCFLGAMVGSVYAMVCLLPGMAFLGNGLWRTAALGAMGTLAFGCSRSALRQSLLFVLLAMALGGVATFLHIGNFWGLAASAGILFALCRWGFRCPPGSREYVGVQLRYGEKQADILALRDTGNSLRDPVTGQSVLIVNAQVANRLLGLTKAQLLSPIETVASGVYPGLRLIPYRSVGQPNGMLAAMRMENVVIDKWKGSTLVAFAPMGFDGEGTYQALTGGIA